MKIFKSYWKNFGGRKRRDKIRFVAFGIFIKFICSLYQFSFQKKFLLLFALFMIGACVMKNSKIRKNVGNGVAKLRLFITQVEKING